MTEPEHDPRSLPEWAQKRLAKANAEADRYREQLAVAEQQFHAIATEDVHLAAAHSRNAELQRQILANTVGLKYGLPPELASRLHGDTEAELTTDARRLVAALLRHA